MYIFYVYEYTVAIFRHTRKGIGFHYRWLWAIMWLLGIELRTCGRAVSAPNHWAISPAQERSFSALSEDWNSVPSIHVQQLTMIWYSTPRGSDTFSFYHQDWSPWRETRRGYLWRCYSVATEDPSNFGDTSTIEWSWGIAVVVEWSHLEPRRQDVL